MEALASFEGFESIIYSRGESTLPRESQSSLDTYPALATTPSIPPCGLSCSAVLKKSTWDCLRSQSVCPIQHDGEIPLSRIRERVLPEAKNSPGSYVAMNEVMILAASLVADFLHQPFSSLYIDVSNYHVGTSICPFPEKSFSKS